MEVRQPIILQNFAENCMEMKEFGPIGEHVRGTPAGSATARVALDFWLNQWKKIH